MSKYLDNKQAALDRYVESRRRIGVAMPPGMPRSKAFLAGYDAGYLDGIRHAESLIPAFVPSEGLARTNDPANSKAAAEGVKVKALYDLITRSLRDNGPGTAQDIANRLGLPLNTVSPRFAYLKRQGICYVYGGVRVGRSYRSVYKIGNGVTV